MSFVTARGGLLRVLLSNEVMTFASVETEGTEDQRPRVLIVDDDAALARALQRYLQRQGMITEMVVDGAEALEQLRAQAFDVMVLDLQLANMDGLDVFRAACDLPSPPATILHSAYLSVQTAVLAIRSGVGEVLEKPVLEDVLVARIRELTVRRRAKLAAPNGADSEDSAAGRGDSSRGGVDSSAVLGLGANRSLPDLERTLILQAFADSGQNLSRAARTLGIPRSTLRDRLRKYGAR